MREGGLGCVGGSPSSLVFFLPRPFSWCSFPLGDCASGELSPRRSRPLTRTNKYTRPRITAPLSRVSRRAIFAPFNFDYKSSRITRALARSLRDEITLGNLREVRAFRVCMLKKSTVAKDFAISFVQPDIFKGWIFVTRRPFPRFCLSPEDAFFFWFFLSFFIFALDPRYDR